MPQQLPESPVSQDEQNLFLLFSSLVFSFPYLAVPLWGLKGWKRTTTDRTKESDMRPFSNIYTALTINQQKKN
jgi:hypothetical protein